MAIKFIIRESQYLMQRAYGKDSSIFSRDPVKIRAANLAAQQKLQKDIAALERAIEASEAAADERAKEEAAVALKNAINAAVRDINIEIESSADYDALSTNLEAFKDRVGNDIATSPEPIASKMREFIAAVDKAIASVAAKRAHQQAINSLNAEINADFLSDLGITYVSRTDFSIINNIYKNIVRNYITISPAKPLKKVAFRLTEATSTPRPARTSERTLATISGLFDSIPSRLFNGVKQSKDAVLILHILKQRIQEANNNLRAGGASLKVKNNLAAALDNLSRYEDTLY